MLPTAADTANLAAIPVINYIDGVACCAGQFAHNRAFAAHDGVDKRRFTNVRSTDNRDRDWMLNVRCPFGEASADKWWMFDVSRRGELPFDCIQ